MDDPEGLMPGILHSAPVAALRSAIQFFRRDAPGQRTLGSAITPGVCTCTTLWTNLMQQTRIPPDAVSHLRKMFDFTAAMRSQVAESCGLAILVRRSNVRLGAMLSHPFQGLTAQPHTTGVYSGV